MLGRLLQTSLAVLLLSLTASAAHAKPIRVAFLDFGKTETGKRAAEEMQKAFTTLPDFAAVDHDQARMAAAGIGYAGSLNLSLQEARDLGSAIGCDFFFTGEAQTLRRSSSDTPTYFESYASIYFVSGRTGRLVSWERPSVKRSTPEAAEDALLKELVGQEALHRYKIGMHRALEDERAERANLVDSGSPIIEALADETLDGQNDTRPPRPYRRLKPDYPEVAARSEIAATVDVLVDIDEKGEVGRIQIARWAGYGLDESVINTVKQLHFFPAMRDGRAIAMRVLLRYNFRKPI